jgi:hypothetical protein
MKLLLRYALVAVLTMWAWPQRILAAPQATAVCGSLVADTVWQRAASPYSLCAAGVTVPTGVALQLEPGVEVQAQNGGRLYIAGAFVAEGTPALPITLTSATKSAGAWQGLSVYGSGAAPALVQLSHVTLEYGGIDNSYGGQIYAENAWVTMTHSIVRGGIRAGLFGWTRGRISAQDTRFESNASAAISLVDVAQHDLTMRNLIASGNGTNAVVINSTNYVSGTRLWQAAGIPYVIDAPIGTLANNSLTLEPGTELQFTGNGALNIAGTLHAIGLPGQPITFTGTAKTPGAWRGISVVGSSTDRAKALLDYTTIEYGGISGANVFVSAGTVQVAHSVIRHSSTDGFYAQTLSYGNVIKSSQIISNTAYGVRTLDPSRMVLAAGNWWGHPSGPTSVPACGNGTGSQVSAGVVFSPVLTDALAAPPALVLSEARVLTLTPRRWFAPADGQSRVYFDLVLRDGNGAPLPGRALRLFSSRGQVVDGGITDIAGKTLAYVTATQAGDAEVYAALSAAAACENAAVTVSKITFTPALALTDLAPDAAAPYLDTDLIVSPMPVRQGVPTTLRAFFKNPLNQPLTIDVDFEFAQSSIGLAFGPIASAAGKVIPANGTLIVETVWIPQVSGHYCVRAQYALVSSGAVGRSSTMAGRGAKQKNLNVYQGGKMPPSDKDSLAKADTAFRAVSKLPGGGTPLHKAVLGGWWGWAKRATTTATRELGGDPPRQDYRVISTAQRLPVVLVQSDAQISSARAAAINAVTNSLADVIADGQAAVIALDRAGGASEAGDQTWASVQTGVQLHYQTVMAAALITVADKLDALVQVAANEGVVAQMLTAAEIQTYQQQLIATGFGAEDLAGYRLVGLSDAEIEAERQEILSLQPQEAALDLIQGLKAWAAAYRALADGLLRPAVFEPSFSISGGILRAQAQSASVGNSMAQMYATAASFRLGNPLSQTATIDLRERNIGMPADWLVTIDPAQVTLAPGAEITVVVNITPGPPSPQYGKPQVAIEGYVGTQLLGGVVIEVAVPGYAPFDGTFRRYLPLARR